MKLTPLSEYQETPIEVHYEAQVRGHWTRVIGEASCGCHWELDINIREGTATFRQCFDLYGAQFTFAGHSWEHQKTCLEALPSGFINRVMIDFESDMTLRDLLDVN